VFAYLPVVPIFYAPFYLLGDIRYGNIAADILIMIAAYWIAGSLNPKTSAYAPLLYALLPASLWLTSVSSTNIMIGAAFLTLSMAALLRRHYAVAAGLLGVALATNQLVLLALPVIGLYYWRIRRLSNFVPAFGVAAFIVVPFYIWSPRSFAYDTLVFQITRPFQTNGYFGLFGLVYSLTGYSLSVYLRFALFFSCLASCLVFLWFRENKKTILISAGFVLLAGPFFLPVDGFWNYYLPAFALACAILPDVVHQRLFPCMTRSRRRVGSPIPSYSIQSNSSRVSQKS
jgi:hypothetical protein